MKYLEVEVEVEGALKQAERRVTSDEQAMSDRASDVTELSDEQRSERCDRSAISDPI